MELSADQVQGNVVVTVVRIKGDLDGSNFRDLIALAQKEYDHGARDFLIDLSETTYTSSAGLVALQSIVKMLRKEKPFDPEAGWGALHEIEREEGKGLLQHVKLLSPQPRVDKVLELAGLKTVFPVFSDRAAAVASF
jgi:anti-anti-sigma regulatory factor